MVLEQAPQSGEIGADGLERRVRDEIYRGRSPERCCDALECVFTPLDYVRDFCARLVGG